MSTGRPCVICSDAAKMKLAATMVDEGASDQAIADRIGRLHRMAVSRHRRSHIMKATQDRLAIVSKGAAPREERRQLAEAAAADAPTPQQFVDAFFGLKAQAEKLQRIEDRLDRIAVVAEANQAPGAVATVAAQQLRAVETGSKLAGAGGFAAPKSIGAGGGAQFNLIIQFGDHEERISATPIDPDATPDVGGAPRTFGGLAGLTPSGSV